MWSVKFSPRAAKQLKKLDRPIRGRITSCLQEFGSGDAPRLRGKALTGHWEGSWRWRVGDYRIIASIEDEKVII